MHRALDFFRIDASTVPTIRVFIEGQGHKYKFEHDITEANLVSYLKDFKAGKAKVHLISK